MHLKKKKFTRRKFDFTQILFEIYKLRRTTKLNYVQLALEFFFMKGKCSKNNTYFLNP